MYPNQTFSGSKGDQDSIAGLLGSGAKYEDDFPPGPIYHFFDPRTNLPLHINPADYPDAYDQYVAVLNSATRTSPDWVTVGDGSWASLPNSYSIPKARDYLFQAITSNTTEGRKNGFGLLFESLGRMIHHIQDMAQPQRRT